MCSVSPNDGSSAELLEVTTEDNRMSAVTQLTSKLAILRETVNRIDNLSVDWRPSQWRPSPTQLFRVLPSSSSDLVYICYVPTFRAAAPPGVVLYEIHALARQRAPLPMPAPQGAKQRVRHGPSRDQDSLEGSARRFLAANPDVAGWIKAIAAVLAVAAIIALTDPVPGDEVAAAGWLRPCSGLPYLVRGFSNDLLLESRLTVARVHSRNRRSTASRAAWRSVRTVSSIRKCSLCCLAALIVGVSAVAPQSWLLCD